MKAEEMIAIAERDRLFSKRVFMEFAGGGWLLGNDAILKAYYLPAQHDYRTRLAVYAPTEIPVFTPRKIDITVQNGEPETNLEPGIVPQQEFRMSLDNPARNKVFVGDHKITLLEEIDRKRSGRAEEVVFNRGAYFLIESPSPTKLSYVGVSNNFSGILREVRGQATSSNPE